MVEHCSKSMRSRCICRQESRKTVLFACLLFLFSLGPQPEMGCPHVEYLFAPLGEVQPRGFASIVILNHIWVTIKISCQIAGEEMFKYKHFVFEYLGFLFFKEGLGPLG